MIFFLGGLCHQAVCYDGPGDENKIAATQPDDEDLTSESETSQEKRIEKKKNMLSKLPPAIPGQIEFFEGDFPGDRVVSLGVVSLDGKGTPGIALLTNGSLEIFSFGEGNTLNREWTGDFSRKRPMRGFSGSIYSGIFKKSKLVYVSVNSFRKSFAYAWKSDHLEKAGRVNGAFVDTLRTGAVSLMSEYGDGVVSYSGKRTYFVDVSGEKPKRWEYPVPEDYYSGCILKWSNNSAAMSKIAVVNEYGAVKIYQGGKQKLGTQPDYGGAIACGATQRKSSFVFVTTPSEKEDAIVTLELGEDKIVETDRSSPQNGAITDIITADLDSDELEEVFGVLRTPAGNDLLFRFLPEYN